MLLTRQTPKQTPPKPQPAFAVACRPQGPKVSPESRAKEPRMAAETTKTAGMWGQTSIDSIGWFWLRRRPLKRETSPNGKSIKSGFQSFTEWSFLISGGSHTFFALHRSPFFLSIKVCCYVERLPRFRPRVKHMGEKTRKNNQSLHIRIPRIGLYDGDNSTVSKPISIN